MINPSININKVQPLFTTSSPYINGVITTVIKDAMEKFIEQIDNHNSVTALGTLEYLDSFAKLNTTNTLCVKTGTQNYSNITDRDIV